MPTRRIKSSPGNSISNFHLHEKACRIYWTKKYFNVTNFNEQQLYDADFNIKIGVCYVKILSDMFNNNTNLVLASYNAGLGNVQKWQQENPIIEYDSEEMPFKETKNYVSRISKIYNCLKWAYSLREKK